MTTKTVTMPLSRRLKADTRATHARLDSRIMAADPFADIANYRRFLTVQYGFHRDLDPLYADPALDEAGEARVIEGARSAFTRVQGLVDKAFARS